MLKSIYRFLSPKYQSLFSEYKVKLEPRYGHGKPAHGELLTIISERKESYKEFLTASLKYTDNIHSFKKMSEEQDASKPVWNNGFLPGLDIVALYAMIALNKPAKYVEVGSGNSTKVAFSAISQNNLNTQIVSIDPHPRAEIDKLADVVIRKPFEATDYSEVLNLQKNDILFIDNSHRILPNSDAMVFFMEILPKLNKGVIVHIHDIYLPYDYPQVMCDRFYSEQYGLAMYLLANPKKYVTLLPNYYISEEPKLAAILAPFWNHPNLKGVETHGGSYWLRIGE